MHMDIILFTSIGTSFGKFARLSSPRDFCRFFILLLHLSIFRMGATPTVLEPTFVFLKFTCHTRPVLAHLTHTTQLEFSFVLFSTDTGPHLLQANASDCFGLWVRFESLELFSMNHHGDGRCGWIAVVCDALHDFCNITCSFTVS